MIKKIAAAFMAVLVFGGLAYYSGILYLEKSVPENQAYMKAPVVFFPEEQRLEQEEQKEYKENPLKDTETARRQVSARADRWRSRAVSIFIFRIGRPSMSIRTSPWICFRRSCSRKLQPERACPERGSFMTFWRITPVKTCYSSIYGVNYTLSYI